MVSKAAARTWRSKRDKRSCMRMCWRPISHTRRMAAWNQSGGAVADDDEVDEDDEDEDDEAALDEAAPAALLPPLPPAPPLPPFDAVDALRALVEVDARRISVAEADFVGDGSGDDAPAPSARACVLLDVDDAAAAAAVYAPLFSSSAGAAEQHEKNKFPKHPVCAAPPTTGCGGLSGGEIDVNDEDDS